ncbi:peptidase 1 [Dermatophagoides farinae]|nr:peptidase 1-like [Dermatophagoides farinae]
MKFILTLLILGSVAVNARPSSIETFQQFKRAFNKQYESVDQEEIARQNFLDSLKFVQTHDNAAINSFSDLSTEEFKAKLMMSDETFEQITAGVIDDDGVRGCEITQKNVPASLDLLSMGYVTSVKSQGPCGSCWAFSCIASVESAYLATKNQSLNLSVQNLMNCASTHGCHGEAPPTAFKYLQKTGVVDAKVYPYFPSEEPCR